jgi:hypothetical protein
VRVIADFGIDYTGDFAIVQSSNFTTLFVLSRERQVEDSVLDVSFLSCPDGNCV